VLRSEPEGATREEVHRDKAGSRPSKFLVQFADRDLTMISFSFVSVFRIRARGAAAFRAR